ncbi:MAG: hypothetical protein ABIO88_01805 [Burkholderiaceae bacterium]
MTFFSPGFGARFNTGVAGLFDADTDLTFGEGLAAVLATGFAGLLTTVFGGNFFAADFTAGLTTFTGLAGFLVGIF